MKFQLKALVAALALSATTVPAQAGMTFATSGDSSMILTLLDFGNNVSATFDLGYSYASFQDLVTAASTTGSYTFNLAGGDYADAWNSFWAIGGANTKWAVYAADGTGLGVGERGIISTYKSGSQLQNSNNLQTSVANFNSYMTNNNALGNHTSVDNGASVVTSNLSQSFAGRANAYGSTGRINASGHVAMDNMDTSMTIIQQLSGANNAAAPTSFNTLGNVDGNYTFTMSSNGLLTFSVPVTTAVPEADSYAMLLAGLGLVGLVARRRKA